jgi:predicted dehydrogenase
MKDGKHSDRRQFLTGITGAGLATRVMAQQGSTQKKLRVGLVGAGGRGSYHGKTIKQLTEQGDPVELISVCDIYQPRLERAETALKVKGYAHMADMLKDPNLDAVVIATPDRQHVFNMMEAIRAGKDVYCEKPVTHWAQFDKLKELVHENRKLKRVIQIGTQYVSDTVWERAGEQIRQGAIGKVVHAQSCYFRRGDGGEAGMPIDDPNAKPGVGVDWETAQADAPRHEFTVSRLFQWRLYMDYSGGPLTDCYPHMLTPLVKMLSAGFPKKVVSTGGRFFYGGLRDVPDTFDLLIQYPQDLDIAFLGSFVNYAGIETLARGSEGVARKTDLTINIEPLKGVDRPRQELPNDTPTRGEGHSDLTVAHLKDFFNCVRTRGTPRGDLELAYRVQTPLIMAMQSHLHNKVALFDEDSETIRLV